MKAFSKLAEKKWCYTAFQKPFYPAKQQLKHLRINMLTLIFNLCHKLQSNPNCFES